MMKEGGKGEGGKRGGTLSISGRRLLYEEEKEKHIVVFFLYLGDEMKEKKRLAVFPAPSDRVRACGREGKGRVALPVQAKEKKEKT